MSQPRPTRSSAGPRAATGGVMILTSLVAAVLAPIIIGLLRSALNDEVRGSEPVPAALLFLVTHRRWLPLLALPGAACGLGLMLTRRFHWLIFTIGTISTLLFFAIVLWSVISLIGPLYQYHPLSG